MRISDTQGNGLTSADNAILLASCIGRSRTWLLAHPEYVLTAEEEARWKEWIARRKNAEPVAYITGEKEFFGRYFHVDPSVLIPRPATEELVDVVLRTMRGEEVNAVIDADTGIVIASFIWGKKMQQVQTIVDVGTGSGCVGISLACELPAMHVVATDISEKALVIAAENARRHQCNDRMTFLLGDALEPMKNFSKPFLVVSNPPYIPSTMTLMKDVQHYEPHSALFSGEEGTDVLEKLMAQAKAHPLCQGVIVECRKEQAAKQHLDS